ncbi:hypothetical protein LAWI1_G006274 [Lachnellula willkommii]|uniref:Uncharacterized protein n=1 Tax=Lachnellula willkommii TaxID=215461 RepID=A0A559M388_9HELO|nr:hypothetical protein LAWI1_G006274 [Lachnellula willkommii]
MLFKNLRSRSKSSSKPPKPSVFRVTSTDSHSHSQGGDAESKVQPVTTATECADDYGKFLAKAQKDAEKLEKKKLREVEEAERRKREVNMSPWARPGF